MDDDIPFPKKLNIFFKHGFTDDLRHIQKEFGRLLPLEIQKPWRWGDARRRDGGWNVFKEYLQTPVENLDEETKEKIVNFLIILFHIWQERTAGNERIRRNAGSYSPTMLIKRMREPYEILDHIIQSIQNDEQSRQIFLKYLRESSNIKCRLAAAYILTEVGEVRALEMLQSYLDDENFQHFHLDGVPQQSYEAEKGSARSLVAKLKSHPDYHLNILKQAQYFETVARYENAAKIYEERGNFEEAKRVRHEMLRATKVKGDKVLIGDDHSVEIKDSIIQRSQIGKETKPFLICPYCGGGLDLPKTPNFCPFCREPLK